MLTLVLDNTPLPVNASIENFQQGKAGYVADAMEQALLLLEDIADLRSLRKHEVFLSLKRDLAMVSLLSTLLSFFHTCTYTLLILPVLLLTYTLVSFLFFFFYYFLGCPQS